MSFSFLMLLKYNSKEQMFYPVVANLYYLVIL